MKIIDTHTHIYSKEFDTDRENVIERAKNAGVKAVFLPNENLDSLALINKLSDEEPEFAFPMVGLHPTCVGNDYALVLSQLESFLYKRKYYAIGETGIDLYWDKTYRKEQKAAFEEQLRWSIALHIPVVIHQRESFDEVMDSIYNVGAESLKGVFHCFNGTVEQWEQIAGLSGFYVGIGGVVTYKNNIVYDTLAVIPPEKIVVETDAPYLSPVPYRGKRNEPSYLTEVIKKLSERYEMPPENIAKITFDNSLKVFGAFGINSL